MISCLENSPCTTLVSFWPCKLLQSLVEASNLHFRYALGPTKNNIFSGNNYKTTAKRVNGVPDRYIHMLVGYPTIPQWCETLTNDSLAYVNAPQMIRHVNLLCQYHDDFITFAYTRLRRLPNQSCQYGGYDPRLVTKWFGFESRVRLSCIFFGKEVGLSPEMDSRLERKSSAPLLVICWDHRL
ncbi:hypothetical protein TNCV_805061 [Trichonephila clavipes]|nr:hypothetical protein TNCV_805061 [Trichonephila clavipes]